MTRISTATLASTLIGALAIVSAVFMAEAVFGGFPKSILPPERIATYPIVAGILFIEAGNLLHVAAMLIRFGGSVQQGTFSDQSSVVDMLIGGNRLVFIQAAANALAVLASNIDSRFGSPLVASGALVAIFFAFLSSRKLIELGRELRR